MTIDYRKQIDKLLIKRKVLVSECSKSIRDLNTSSQELEATQEAQKALQAIAQGIQQKVHDKIAIAVTRCLSAVFDDPYEFRIRFEQKRGKTEAHLFFVRDNHEVRPLKASGGGVVDVASFALRLACVMMSRPRLRPLIVLDEPFKFVSANYLPRVKFMLYELARELKVQFVIVTHLELLRDENTITIGE